MAIWQWGLLALFCVWALQSLGVWLQMRHYTDVFKGVTNQFNLAHEGKFAGLLQSIAPGARWVESFRVKTSGF